MLTTLQTRKLSHLFKIFDFDHNGLIQESDLLGITENISIINGILDGSTKDNVLQNSIRKIWHALQVHFKNPAMQTCSMEQWLEFLEIKFVSKNKSEIICLIQAFAEQLYSIFDHNDDGKLSQREYMCIFMSFRVDIKQAFQCFSLLDINQDGFISHEEFVFAVLDFFQNENKEAPGNWLFGDWESYYFSTRIGIKV
ncbi:MAG: EF-hand domain-containing protein [Cyclobacteriaceae bacterium]|nr:EF-hand domain-containing protein [Cyclobacteriaceae bacterium]